MIIATGADDGVPAAALERVPGRHEGEAVQQTGGGPALQSQDVGRRHEVHDGNNLHYYTW